MKKLITTLKPQTMKTLIITSAIMFSAIFSIKAESGVEKYYDVTNEGQFHYVYWSPDVSVKKGVKPITNRTFYLETIKYGVLPSNLTYREFLELSPEEIKALLKNKAYKIESEDMNALNSSEVENKIEAPVVPVDEAKVEIMEETEGKSTNLPWIVEVVVVPSDGYQIPEEVLKNKIVEDPQPTENASAIDK